MKRVLVAGSSGFIGEHILKALHDESPYKASGLTRWKSDRRINNPSEISEAVVDVSKTDELLQVLAGHNAVVYAISPDTSNKREFIRESVHLVRDFLELIREADVEHFVVVSCATTSINTLSKHRQYSNRDHYLPGTLEADADAKYAVELECYREAADGQSISIINPTVCLGKGAVLPSPDLLTETFSPKHRISFVDVSDVARKTLEILFEKDFGKKHLINSHNSTIDEFKRRLKQNNQLYGTLVDDWEKIRDVSLFQASAWFQT